MDRSLVVRLPYHRSLDFGLRFSVGIFPETIAEAEHRRQQEGGGREVESRREESRRRRRRNVGKRLQTNVDGIHASLQAASD